MDMKTSIIKSLKNNQGCVSPSKLKVSGYLTWITDKRQESVDELVGGLGEVVEVRLAVVVDHEGAPLLVDEPDGCPDCDAGEWTEQFLVAVGI